MDAAAIDGVTGPGRRVTLIVAEPQEITFRLKRKTIDVTSKDGSLGQYDLAEISSIQVNSDGIDFTLAITSKEPKNDGTDAEGRTETDGFKQGQGKRP